MHTTTTSIHKSILSHISCYLGGCSYPLLTSRSVHAHTAPGSGCAHVHWSSRKINTRHQRACVPSNSACAHLVDKPTMRITWQTTGLRLYSAMVFGGWLVVGVLCSGNIKGQHQERYWLVTVCTHGDFTVLPYWQTRQPAPWPDIRLSHIMLTLNQPVLVLP